MQHHRRGVSVSALALRARRVEWPLREPFVIARETQTSVPCIEVALMDGDGTQGRGEAAGVDYAGETPETMLAQIDAVRTNLKTELSHHELAALLPAGGARNALDCALWDLRAKQQRTSVWRLANLAPPKAVTTAFTLGLMDESALRARAREHREFSVLKVKTNTARGIEPARIVHEAAPHACLILDPNQDWSIAALERFAPRLPDIGVILLEQPTRVGDDAHLSRLTLPVLVACDESFTDSDSMAPLIGRYDVLNIKLDKAGGLTEALRCVSRGRALGFELMVGCMVGSSLAMAPAVLVAQSCAFVDLDGPLLQAADVHPPIVYKAGAISPASPALWG